MSMMVKGLTGVMSWPAAETKKKPDASSEQPNRQGFKTVSEEQQVGTSASAGLMDSVKHNTSKLDESTADGTEDRFLKLLVAQMRHQDPMNPMENAEVTSQMAQISTVRGIEALNRSMEGVTASNAQSSVLASVGMIGKQVLAPGERFEYRGQDQGEARLGFELAEKASKARVDLMNDNGVLLYSHTLENLEAGTHSLAWDGTDGNGDPVPVGMYRMKVTAVDGKTAVESTGLVPVRVTGVAQTSTGAMLELEHAKPVSPADARLII
ncbi:MAG: flagellar hook capping FlgD N-terminal domain-containing protein [Lautropia sp.]|nr:flagellar hook capping FlgD N-terminal domain-containing protein [Lautropia sp.]